MAQRAEESARPGGVTKRSLDYTCLEAADWARLCRWVGGGAVGSEGRALLEEAGSLQLFGAAAGALSKSRGRYSLKVRPSATL